MYKSIVDLIFSCLPGLGASTAHDARLQGDGLQLGQHPRPPSQHGGQTQGAYNVT